MSCFRPEGSAHQPRTRARLLYDGAGLYGLFRVDDCYVRSVHVENGAPVYRDSCVELFVEPRPGEGYFNFEFNAGGAVLASHILDPTRTSGGFRRFVPFSAADYERIRVHHSLPPTVDPEWREPTPWALEFFIPFSILTDRAGAVRPGPGARWRGNLFKCGDETSHPHWASWSTLRARNFHLPDCFGLLRFG